ncbi:21484_t:CDS:2 [Gigaspora margarita]|uniref:21484_t:CDS:1 n=1 Tax=Gigaspora margarita TaxID=4874 RepID=A0ABM8VWU6_GIGMA|nr:21484_t:CDS:2 [Gigaspora margarita]
MLLAYLKVPNTPPPATDPTWAPSRPPQEDRNRSRMLWLRCPRCWNHRCFLTNEEAENGGATEELERKRTDAEEAKAYDLNSNKLVLEKPAKDGIKELKSFLGNPKNSIVNYYSTHIPIDMIEKELQHKKTLPQGILQNTAASLL